MGGVYLMGGVCTCVPADGRCVPDERYVPDRRCVYLMAGVCT